MKFKKEIVWTCDREREKKRNWIPWKKVFIIRIGKMMEWLYFWRAEEEKLRGAGRTKPTNSWLVRIHVSRFSVGIFFYFFSFLWPTFFVGCIDFPFKVHHHAYIWSSTEYHFCIRIIVCYSFFLSVLFLNINFDSSTPNLKTNLIITIKTGVLSLEHEFIAISLIFSLLWY